MTPAEYKAARIALGMRQGELAAALGVSRATVNNREAGRRPVSEEAAMAIRALAGKMNADVEAFDGMQGSGLYLGVRSKREINDPHVGRRM